MLSILDELLTWNMATLLGVMAIACFWVMSWNSNYVRLIEKIPGPKCRLFLGNTWDFLVPFEETFVTLCACVKQYSEQPGPVMRLWLGWKAYVCVMKAEQMETIMSSTKHITKSHDYTMLRSWLGRGLITSTGDHWRAHRKQLTPSFHFRIVDKFVGVVNEHSDILLEKLNEFVGRGKFNIESHISHCVLDVICETTMGKRVNAQTDDQSQYVNAIEQTLERNSLEVINSVTRQVIEDRKRIHEEQGIGAVGGEEQEAVAGQKRRLAFLDLLLYASTTDRTLSLNDIHDEVSTFMFAGHDTSTSCLCWTLYSLGHHLDVQDKVAVELDRIMADGDGNLTSSDLMQMKYLDAVIKESMRLYPPVPVIGRELEEDAVIGGFYVPRSTSILIHLFLCHRDPTVFPDPETFDPTRFLAQDGYGEQRHPYAYVPFSAGPRNCIGQKFALMEMKVVLAKILHRFAVKSHDSVDQIKYVFQPVLRPFNGTNISIELRKTPQLIS